MINNVQIVVAYIVFIAIVCKVWNWYGMKQYKKNKESNFNHMYGAYINNINQIKPVGVGSDSNGDYDVAKAIEKIEIPANLRIKYNE